MDSRQLLYFREIIASGSLSGAARNLGIAQPSLSQLIHNMEQSMGVELLIRSARGVTATEAGLRLYEYACRIERLLNEARAEVINIGTCPSGRVDFGMPPSISMALSIPMAETIRLEMPEIQFCATEAMSGHLREWVMSGEIDMALLYDDTGLGDCMSDLLLTEELWVYSASDDWQFASAPGTPIDLADVLKTELVLPSKRHGLRTFIDRAARSRRLEPTVTMEIDSLTQIRSLVARGSGHTILSPFAVHDLVAGRHLVGSPIRNPWLRRRVYLIRSSSNRMTKAIRATEKCCREVVADLIKRGFWQAELHLQG